jgi:HEAT repeat protein
MAGLTELSVAELVEGALQSSFDAEDEVGNQESIKSWEAIGELHKRADLETLSAGKHLLHSDLAWHRARGADILGQLGSQAGSWSEERFEALATALLIEREMRAVHALIHAITHLHEPRSLPYLLPFIKSDSARVRRAVAMALNPTWGQPAVSGLIELMSDQSALVRDWATFAFRTSKFDSPEIRAALLHRLADDDVTTRSEAICALAKRGDLRCLAQLRNDLSRSETWDDCHLEAARVLVAWPDEDEDSAEQLLDALKRAFPEGTGRN